MTLSAAHNYYLDKSALDNAKSIAQIKYIRACISNNM